MPRREFPDQVRTGPVLSYLDDLYSSNRTALFPMLPPLHLHRTPAGIKFLSKTKSETALEIPDDVVNQSAASCSRRQSLAVAGSTGECPSLGRGGAREGWAVPASPSKSFKSRKKRRTSPAFAEKSPTPDQSMPGKVIPGPSSSLSSTTSSFDDVYSLSCLTDLREMRMKEDPDFFLRSKDERPQLQERQPASSRSCRRFVNLVNFDPETASQSNASTFLSDCSCSGRCVCSDKSTASTARIEQEMTVESNHVDVVRCRSQSLVEAKDKAVLSNSSSTNVCSRSSVGGRKSTASIVPVEEPINDRTGNPPTTLRLSSKVSILGQSLKSESETLEKTAEFPEVVLCLQNDCQSSTLETKSTKIDDLSVLDDKQMPISTNANMFMASATAGADEATAAATAGDSSPASIVVDSKSRLCLSCAESLMTKWRRVIVALTKNHRSLIRKTRISGLVASSSELDKEDNKNSTFSFIFTTSLSASKDPVSFFDQGIFQRSTESARTSKEDFDDVEDICSARTNAALASITSTFTGVLLYRQRCWHLTNYLCIGDRYCASNGQLLCQMSVAGLVILCCHDNRWSMEAGNWSEPQQPRPRNNPGSPLRSTRLLEQPTLVAARMNSPSGYTHPECDSDHAIPMMPCVCGAKVKPSERHNRFVTHLLVALLEPLMTPCLGVVENVVVSSSLHYNN